MTSGCCATGGGLIDSTSGPGVGVCLSRDSAHPSALLLRETQAVELLLAEPFRPRPLQTFWDHCDGVGMAL